MERKPNKGREGLSEQIREKFRSIDLCWLEERLSPNPLLGFCTSEKELEQKQFSSVFLLRHVPLLLRQENRLPGQTGCLAQLALILGGALFSYSEEQ